MTTRPELGVPEPCYPVAAFYCRTADALCAIGLAGGAKGTPLADIGVSDPCYSGAAFYRRTADARIELELAESAQGHPKLIQVVQASTTLPRRRRLDPGSPEGAGWSQVLPRRCRRVLLSPDGVGKCLRHHGCPIRQVWRPGVAGVVPKWCRLAPGSPEGAGRCYSPQMV